MNFVNAISIIFLGIFSIWVVSKFFASIRLVPTMSAFIVERLGKYNKTLQPGFHILIPFLDKVSFIQDLKEQAIDVEPQECFTKDNVKVEVDGVIYISVADAVNASYGITDYKFAAIQLSQTTTRSIIGTIDLDKTFEERELISSKVVQVLSEVSKNWGINVHRYEVKNINPPVSVKNAMEKQMTAERERRAIIAKSEGTKQATINDSEGKKAEIVNISEGEMLRRINSAEGMSKEIEAIASATAESIKKIANAIGSKKGKDAVQMRLSQAHLTNMSKIAKKNAEVIIAADVTNFNKVLEGLGIKEL